MLVFLFKSKLFEEINSSNSLGDFLNVLALSALQKLDFLYQKYSGILSREEQRSPWGTWLSEDGTTFG